MSTTYQTPNADPPDNTTCVIAGGGPAGLVLGLLLARAGIEVTVLEKHADFLRDFRGDTVHPTTLGLLEDLGLIEQFNELPQSKLTHLELPNARGKDVRSEEHTSELQSRGHLVCRLLLEKKKKQSYQIVNR